MGERQVHDRPKLRDPSPPNLPSREPNGLVAAGFAIGATWALFLAFTFLGEEPPAGSAPLGALLSRLFLAFFLGLGHGALLALAGSALSRIRFVRRHPRTVAIACALILGTLYAAAVTSVVKFKTVGSHLRTEDLWFLTRSLRQLSAETSAAEHLFLVGTALLPLILASAMLSLLVFCRRFPIAPTPGRLALLALVAYLGAAGATLGHPGARRAALVYFPDTRGLAALLHAPVPHNEGGAENISGTPIAPFAPSPGFESKNVLVLMLESVPWKRLHGPESRPGSTPRLDALARESVVFDRAYATSTHSDYAQTSILASLHPRKFEGHDYFHDLSYPRTLFWDPLVPLGWRSALFSCQNESWGNMIAFLRTPNLQLLRHAPDWPKAEHRGDGSESKVFEETPIAAFFEWLDEDPGRPFAVYLNFQATHYPYMVPSGWKGPYQPSAIDFPTTFLSYPQDKIPVMENRFHNALAYVDESVGRVVDGLAARGLLDRTALLVVSDHGEAFYEHGLPTHGTTLLEEQVRTAMLLRLPGVAPARIEQPVSVLDAIPTIYRWMGLPRHGNFQGRDDVLEPGYSAAGRPLPMTIQGMTREDGLLLDGWKYLVNWDRREKALFDLSSDPDERRSLAAVRPQELERLDASLHDLLGRQLGYYRARGWERGRYPPPLP